MALPELLWNNLDEFVKDYTKGLQELADTLAPDPGADNSMFAVDPLYEFDCCMWYKGKVRFVTDQFNDGTHGNGYQGLVYTSRITLQNNVLHVHEPTYMGKGQPAMDWNGYSAEDYDVVKGAAENIVMGIRNNYSANDVIVHANQYGNVYFQPALHNKSDIGLKYTEMGTERSSSELNLQFQNLTLGWENDYVTNSTSLGDLGTGAITLYIPVKTPVIALIKNDSEASNLVSVFSPYNTHNQVLNATSQGSYKIYYGDNYIIYSIPSGTLIKYNDIFTATNTVANAINGWNPGNPPIVVPTYEENKHRDDPDPDADIEVEMNLNDAAFGEGLSHYYVTTVDAPVLSDISEAMSSWNINNTGKDLYRNLLSCRITKVGPIPAKNSTFVIYGEELLHGGSPISINKITGNPSMDLGEYEIQPKFNDFRDYAPYTKIEMFIPYCGWVALPSHVMSSEESPKIITGTLLCDIIAGTCKAVIKCNDTVVAEASGFTAVDVPFTGENVGMKMAGIASAITSYGNTASKTVGNIASGGMSGGAGAGASAAGGLVGLLGSYAQLHSAFNANYTEICGKTGDGCNVAGLNKVYIKIQRPKTGGYEAPDFVPEDYGHTTGFIAMKKSQISDCEGLIVCANPDTSGIGGATDRERQMIKNLLESGIIVRHTEPEP